MVDENIGAPASGQMIVAEGINVRRGDTRILNDVHVALGRASTCAVLGANGAGKSTLLQVIAGDLTPDSGEVRIKGRSVLLYSLAERAQLMGMLRQETSLEFPFTVEEVVAMGRIPHTSATMAESRRTIEQVIDELGLSLLRQRDYTTLSGGEKQRVQIARVLAQVWNNLDGGCLLLDEPTAALDLRYQSDVMWKLQQLKHEGLTVVAVLHDLNLAARFADHIVLLKDGGVLTQGDPGEVLTAQNVELAYGLPVEVIDSKNGPVVVPISREAGSVD